MYRSTINLRNHIWLIIKNCINVALSTTSSTRMTMQWMSCESIFWLLKNDRLLAKDQCTKYMEWAMFNTIDPQTVPNNQEMAGIWSQFSFSMVTIKLSYYLLVKIRTLISQILILRPTKSYFTESRFSFPIVYGSALNSDHLDLDTKLRMCLVSYWHSPHSVDVIFKYS